MSTGSGPLFRGILSSVYTSSSSSSRAARHPSFSAAPTKYLLLQDVPKTARPSDVLRALKDSGTVAQNFPLSAVTSQPPSYPRYPSLTRTFHLTAPTLSVAASIRDRLRKAPIFPSLRVVDLGTNSRQSDVTPPPRVIFSTSDAKMWVQGQLIPEPTSGYSRSDSTGGRDRNQGRARGQRDLRDDTPDGEGQRSGRRGETRAGIKPTFSSLSSDPFWCMDATKRGRRVVVRGIPGMATYDMVRKLAKNFGILEGEEGCVQMPRSPGGVKSIFCFTVDSVSNAHRLQKYVHLSHFNRNMYDSRYPLQAEVW